MKDSNDTQLKTREKKGISTVAADNDGGELKYFKSPAEIMSQQRGNSGTEVIAGVIGAG